MVSAVFITFRLVQFASKMSSLSIPNPPVDSRALTVSTKDAYLDGMNLLTIALHVEHRS
jgi:hypothetical protein